MPADRELYVLFDLNQRVGFHFKLLRLRTEKPSPERSTLSANPVRTRTESVAEQMPKKNRIGGRGGPKGKDRFIVGLRKWPLRGPEFSAVRRL